MASTQSPSTVGLVLLATLALLLVVATVEARTVCPQRVANDPNPRFCARNSFGQMDVTRSEFENWNCNHPFNKYVSVSQIACAPVPPVIACVPATCDNAGPTVCARLASTDPRWPRAFTVAVFGNQCQLTLYNCRNPTQQYVAAPNQRAACTSVGL